MIETTNKNTLITFDNWSKNAIEEILDLSQRLKEKRKKGEITDLLKNKTLFMIFFEQSTRTRNSLEAAMTQLGGHAHDLTSDKMQISHGESPKDTAKVLSRMGECISIRNCFYNIGNKYINDIAEHSDVPVISMQDDIYHPLQSIADIMTIREIFGSDLRGLKVAICWTYASSHAKPLSVPQSQSLLFPRFQLDVTIAHPAEFPLQEEILDKAKKYSEAENVNFKVVNTLEEAVENADIVIPKNWGGFSFFKQFEDNEECMNVMKLNLDKYKNWILDESLYSIANKNAKIMHALPADRGNEIVSSLLDGANSIVYDEAENRLHTAKAILSSLIK